MIGTLHATTLDCPDPHALATFYQGVFGGELGPDEGRDWVDLVISETQSLGFQRSEGYVPPTWPSVNGAQQMHLDVVVADMEAAHEQLTSLGAVQVDKQQTFWVYRDPVGHFFCIFK